MRKLLQERDAHLQKLGEMEDSLKQRKETLYRTRDVTKWEVSADIDISSLADRSTAFHYMLPRETKIVKRQE